MSARTNFNSISRFLTRGFSDKSRNIYEVRVYQCYPKEFKKYVQLNSSEDFKIRLKASSPLGFWRTEVGTLSQLFHIWPFTSVSERAKIRESLAGNEKWDALFTRLAETWDWQTSNLCESIGSVQTKPLFEKGFYYYIYSKNIGNKFVEKFKIPKNLESSTGVMGQFKVTVGDAVGAVYTVINCKDLDSGYELMAANQEILIDSKSKSSLIYPLPISPLQ